MDLIRQLICELSEIERFHEIGCREMESGIVLTVSDDDKDVAYLALPDHPGRGTPGVAVKQMRLRDLTPYSGPDLYFDFDKDGQLIGIEILA